MLTVEGHAIAELTKSERSAQLGQSYLSRIFLHKFGLQSNFIADQHFISSGNCNLNMILGALNWGLPLCETIALGHKDKLENKRLTQL